MNILASLNNTFPYSTEGESPAEVLYNSSTYYFPFNSSLTNLGTQSQTWSQSSVTYASTGRANQANALSITKSEANNAGTMGTNFVFPSGTGAVASVTLWVRKQENLTTAWPVYIYAQLVSTTRFGIFWNSNSGGNNFLLTFGGQNFNFVNADLNTNNWVQLAFTYNRNSNNIKLYINNTVAINTSFTSWSNVSANTALRNYENNLPTLTYHLARLAYWANKELTASEITTLVNDW